MNFHLFLRIFSARASRSEEVAETFIETCRDLDEETKKLLLFQIKHDIEYGYGGGFFITKEWENMRYENIKEFNKVTLQGNCIA